MSDQINNTNSDSKGNVMKELSDIKSSLAVNTSETQNIKGSIAEIKSDIREIKTKFVNQEQHKVLTDCIADHELRLRADETSITRIMTWGSALILLIGIIEFIISKFVKI